MLTGYVALVVPPIVIACTTRRAHQVRVDRRAAEATRNRARSNNRWPAWTVRAFSQEAAESRRFGSHIDSALRAARRKILAVDC
jgi:hypothetical protein